MHNFLLRWILPQMPVGACGLPRTYLLCSPSLFDPPKKPSMGRQGTFPWSRVVILSLYSSRAQLMPLAFCLECLGENTASSKHNFAWQTPAVHPSISYLKSTNWFLFSWSKLHIEYVVTSNNPLRNHSERTASKSSLIWSWSNQPKL